MSVADSLRSVLTRSPEMFARRLESRLDEVESAVQDVFEYAQRRVRQLSGHDPERVLTLIFDRGSFLHPMSREDWRNSSEAQAGDPLDHIHVQNEFFQAFNSLSRENQIILSRLLAENDHETPLAFRCAPSDRAADAEILLDTMKGLMLLLKCRCGVDGFWCLARNNEAFQLTQNWFFSDEELNTYLTTSLEAWNPHEISDCLATFSLSMSPHRYAIWMRGAIKDTIDNLFSQAIGQKNATFNYDNYETTVLLERGLKLVGWTHPTFACPSTLPLDIRPLEKLLRAVRTGECYFRRITEAQRALHLSHYMQRVMQGKGSEGSASGVTQSGGNTIS